MKKEILIPLLFFAFSLLYSQPEIGLALSGGGARGLAHIGVLKVIDEMEIPISYIAGTSSGAVIGALYAAGYSAVEIEAVFLNIDWEDIYNETISRADQYIGNKRWKPYANYNLFADKNLIPQIPQALLSGHKLINIFFDIMYDYSHIQDFDKLPIPYRCVATDILSGEKKIFANGSLHETVRASMSFPTIFAPFPLNGKLYIDGGIVGNLPAEVAYDMGADIVIGIKTTSGLKKEEDLTHLISILDQTVNLNITKNVENSESYCDLLIEPDLQGINIMDMNRKAEIIAIGEKAARKSLTELSNEFKKTSPKKVDTLPASIQFDEIRVVGNKYMSDAKVREFIDLTRNVIYTKKDISKAISKAYNSDLFKYIYPVINKDEDRYFLSIFLEERERIKYGFDFTYNDKKEMSAGVTIDFNNIIQKNSKLLLNIQLGDQQELNLDYVKNFGKFWGVYFRVFPNLKEYLLHSYNQQHEKTNSVLSLEYGSTFGVGFFGENAFILETYCYWYHSRLYQNIAEFDEKEFTSAGIGAKLLREKLDDFLFPMKGSEFFLKYAQADKELFSDFDFREFYSRLRLIIPVTDRIALTYRFEYGSHFEDKGNDFDPFYIGGLNSYLGLYASEKIAPIFKIITFGIRTNLWKNIFIDFNYNILNLGNVDYWQPEKFLFSAGGIVFGYKTFLGPIRLAFARNDEAKNFLYFSLGYEFDQFEFSRR
jgi:NTE family protein